MLLRSTMPAVVGQQNIPDPRHVITLNNADSRTTKYSRSSTCYYTQQCRQYDKGIFQILDMLLHSTMPAVVGQQNIPDPRHVITLNNADSTTTKYSRSSTCYYAQQCRQYDKGIFQILDMLLHSTMPAVVGQQNIPDPRHVITLNNAGSSRTTEYSRSSTCYYTQQCRQ